MPIMRRAAARSCFGASRPTAASRSSRTSGPPRSRNRGASRSAGGFRSRRSRPASRATLPIVGEDSDDDVALRKQQWGNLSDKAREQFFWAHPPAETFDAARRAVPAGGRDAEGKGAPGPDVFLLGLVAPEAVDYLRLTDNFRQLDRRGADGAWDCARVNPYCRGRHSHAHDGPAGDRDAIRGRSSQPAEMGARPPRRCEAAGV